jgi:hypothetical protein
MLGSAFHVTQYLDRWIAALCIGDVLDVLYHHGLAGESSLLRRSGKQR